MDYPTFKTSVEAYMLRSSAALTKDGVDLVLLAANKAKLWAQRQLDFELAKTSVDMTINSTDGGLLSTATDHFSGNPVAVNKIERAFISYDSGQGYRPIELADRTTQVRRLTAAWEGVEYSATRRNYPQNYGMLMPTLVRQANRVYVWPNTTEVFPNGTAAIALDVVQWMPEYTQPADVVTLSGVTSPVTAGTYTLFGTYNDNNVYSASVSGTRYYLWREIVSGGWIVSATIGDASASPRWNGPTTDAVDGSYAPTGGTGTITITSATPAIDTDFFLDYCHDWMLYKTCMELNLFLKDAQRVAIDAGMVDAAWLSVVSWNDTLMNSDTQVNLD